MRKHWFLILGLIILAKAISLADAPAMLNLLDGDLNARTKSLGVFLVASGNKADSFLLNPAGLAYSPYPELGITYNKLLTDTRIAQIGFLYPLERSGWGISVSQFDGGMFDVIESGQFKGSISAKKDECISLSYGREITNGVSVGLNAKYIQSTLLENNSANAIAGDLGILFNPYNCRISIGAAIHNIGTPVKYLDVNEDLPVRGELGTVISLYNSYKHRFNIGGGIIWRKGENDVSGDIGSEYVFYEMIALRTKYSLDKSYINPFAFGLGFMVLGNQLDYTWSNSGVEDIHRMSITFHFGQGGSYGEGIGYYKKGMYELANSNLKRIPKSNSRYEDAQNTLHSSESEIASRYLLETPISLKLLSKEYPMVVKVMKNIPTGIYNLLPDFNVVPCSVSIKNNTEKNADFLIKYKYDFQQDEDTLRIALSSNEEKMVSLYPILPSSIGANFKTENIHKIIVNVFLVKEDGKPRKITDDFKDSVIFHPNNQFFIWVQNAFGDKIKLFDTLSAWVVPNDPEMMSVISKSGERGARCSPEVKIVGNQDSRVFLQTAEQSDVDYLKQIEIIYNTLKEDYNITYLNQPILDIRGNMFASQRVKYPNQTLYNKGNCIELSVLFASLLESIGINPIIMFMPNDGHCVVGWEIPGDNKYMYRLLETNQFGKDFNTVLKEANIWVQKYGLEGQFNKEINFKNGIYEDGDVIILNIAKLREKIHPSPYIPIESIHH